MDNSIHSNYKDKEGIDMAYTSKRAVKTNAIAHYERMIEWVKDIIKK